MRRPVFAMAALAAIISSLAPWPAVACLWDSDTLETESKGIPEQFLIIVGRFARNPPLYYQMRLERVSKRIAADPNDLNAYDDAGVACDRLDQGDEAIAWMEKKRARLDLADQASARIKDHRYRYLANVGTFWAHRWARKGADRDKISEVKTAREFIAQAIALNPEAHFGREKYQLAILDWIIEPPKIDWANTSVFPSLIKFGDRKQSPSEAVRGLSGLISLGNAWESVDVFNALAASLDADRKTALAFFAALRAGELADQGRKSMLPGAPVGGLLRAMLEMRVLSSLTSRDEAGSKSKFLKLRSEAEAWQRGRTEYMMQRLESGKHPDTTPDFWNQYRDPAPPSLDSVQNQQFVEIDFSPALLAIGIVALLMTLFLSALAVIYVLARRHQARRKPTTAEL